jgi:hypothetical protein
MLAAGHPGQMGVSIPGRRQPNLRTHDRMNGGQLPPAVMPGFMPGIHVLAEPVQDVDGRDKPDHGP